jgi:hypothetical protein
MNFRISFPPSASSAKSAFNFLVEEEWAAVVSANLQRATRLSQAILQKKFTGEHAC